MEIETVALSDILRYRKIKITLVSRPLNDERRSFQLNEYIGTKAHDILKP